MTGQQTKPSTMCCAPLTELICCTKYLAFLHSNSSQEKLEKESLRPL